MRTSAPWYYGGVTNYWHRHTQATRSTTVGPLVHHWYLNILKRIAEFEKKDINSGSNIYFIMQRWMEIRLVQGHCDLFEVLRKGIEAEMTDDAVATAAEENTQSYVNLTENRVKCSLQLSELISSITVTITIRQLSRQRGPRVTQNTNSPLVSLERKKIKIWI